MISSSTSEALTASATAGLSSLRWRCPWRRSTASGLFVMAAAYAFHIAENQPFVDGNKRTALNAALVFLDINGHVLDDPDGRLYGAMMDLSRRALDKPGLAELLRELAEPVD